MSALGVVVKKEIIDNLRDKRAVSTALLMPLLGPAALLAVFFAIEDAEQKTKSPEVPVVGREHAPALMGFLEAQGVRIQAAPADPDAAVRAGTVDVVVRIPTDFGDSLRKGAPAVVEIVCDPSRQSAAPTLSRVENLLEAYGKQIGALRLLVRGVDPEIAQAVRVERVDVGAPQAGKALLLGSLPLFLLMACFIGGLYVAIDLTAGEREKGTLEPLLLNPVSRTTLVLAKALATWLFSLLSVAVSLLAFALVVPAVPFAEVGIDLNLPPRVIAGYALLFTPTALLASSLQLLVGTVSKTTKTAQASLGFIVLGPVLAGMVITLFPQQPTLLKCIVPALGESILAIRMLKGEDVDLAQWLANAGMNGALSAILIALTAKLFGARMLSS